MTNTNNKYTVLSFQPDGHVGVEKIARFYPEYFTEFSLKTVGFEIRNNRGRIIACFWPRLGEEY